MELEKDSTIKDECATGMVLGIANLTHKVLSIVVEKTAKECYNPL